MLTTLRDSEGQLPLQQCRADQAAAPVGADRMDRVDVGVPAAERDDPVGTPPRRLDPLPIGAQQTFFEILDAFALPADLGGDDPWPKQRRNPRQVRAMA